MNTLKVNKEREWQRYSHRNIDLNNIDPDDLLTAKKDFFNQYSSQSQEFRPQILCVALPDKNHISIKSYDNDSHSFALSKIGPNGILLQYCDWHSGISKAPDIYTPLSELCHTQSPAEYSVWESVKDVSGNIDVICYDQCQAKRKIEYLKEVEYIQDINTLISMIEPDNQYIEIEYQNFLNAIKKCNKRTLNKVKKMVKSLIILINDTLLKYQKINIEDQRIQNYYTDRDQDYINAVQCIWNWNQYLNNITNYSK